MMWIFDKIKSMFAGVGSFLLRVAKSQAGRIADEIGDLAYTVVQQVERQSGGLSSTGKLELAKRLLVQELGRRSMKYTINAVEIAITGAVGLLKENGEEIKDPG